MKFHRIAEIFPMMDGVELRALTENIKVHGLREPVWTYNGEILDGRNRYTACMEVGIVPQYREFTGTDLDAVEFVWSLNRTRRHLTSSQAACCDAMRNKLEDAYAPVREAAKERQLSTLKQNKADDAPVRQLIAERSSDDRKTTAIRAKVAGTNRAYVDLADRLLNEKPEVFAQVQAGEKTLTEVQREIKREEIIANLESISTKEAKAVAHIYDVIVIDPPWPMINTGMKKTN